MRILRIEGEPGKSARLNDDVTTSWKPVVFRCPHKQRKAEERFFGQERASE
jgi:hypothetical protein